MSGDIVPRVGDSVGTVTTSPIGQSLSSADADFTGSLDDPWSCWDRVPERVRAALAHLGALPTPVLLSGAERPETRRRGPRHYQRAHAWALGRDTVMVLRSERQLRPVGDKRFAPTSEWSVDPDIWLISGGTAKRRTGLVPAQSSATATEGTGSEAPEESNLTDHMLYLPWPVRKQLAQTVVEPHFQDSYFVQWTHDERPDRQEIGCIRLTDQKVVGVRAERAFNGNVVRRDSDAMAQLPWQVTAYTADLSTAPRSAVDPSTRGQLDR